jgi:GxxExxY protein
MEDKVIVEDKAIERLAAIHDVQLLSQLRASGKSVGLIINFQGSLAEERPQQNRK